METNYAKSAYRTFLFWGVCSSLGVTVSTLVDATLVGNFIGSTGLAVANIATLLEIFKFFCHLIYSGNPVTVILR